MFKCRECESYFGNPNRIREMDGLDTPPYRYSESCPSCSSEDFAELIGICNYCNADICKDDEYYILKNGEMFCNDCIERK